MSHFDNDQPARGPDGACLDRLVVHTSTLQNRRKTGPSSPGLEITLESLNARFRQSTRRRGHFPNEQAALKVLYLTVRERRPNRSNPTGQINGWKTILNTLAMTYGDRLGTN